MFFTERLMLRGIDPDADLNSLVHWFNNEEMVWSMRPEAPRPTAKETAKKFIESVVARKDNLPLFCVCEKPKELPEQLSSRDDLFLDDAKAARYPFIGILNFHQPGGISFVNRVVAFGIGFDKAHQGLGYGTELLEWGLKYAFQTLGLHKMELSADADNAPAIKLYEKVGFRMEGRRRSNVFKKGVWVDTLEMGILETEYFERQSKPSK